MSRRRGQEQPVSDINITPLTDVMLVLLVIFMISSPVLLAKGLSVHLPHVDEAQQLEEEDHVLYITDSSELYLDGREEPYTLEELSEQFATLVENADEENESVKLFIRADHSVTYQDMTNIMFYADQAGIEQIGLVQNVSGSIENDNTDAVPVDSGGTEE